MLESAQHDFQHDFHNVSYDIFAGSDRNSRNTGDSIGAISNSDDFTTTDTGSTISSYSTDSVSREGGDSILRAHEDGTAAGEGRGEEGMGDEQAKALAAVHTALSAAVNALNGKSENASMTGTMHDKNGSSSFYAFLNHTLASYFPSPLHPHAHAHEYGSFLHHDPLTLSLTHHQSFHTKLTRIYYRIPITSIDKLHPATAHLVISFLTNLAADLSVITTGARGSGGSQGAHGVSVELARTVKALKELKKVLAREKTEIDGPRSGGGGLEEVFRTLKASHATRLKQEATVGVFIRGLFGGRLWHRNTDTTSATSSIGIIDTLSTLGILGTPTPPTNLPGNSTSISSPMPDNPTAAAAAFALLPARERAAHLRNLKVHIDTRLLRLKRTSRVSRDVWNVAHAMAAAFRAYERELRYVADGVMRIVHRLEREVRIAGGRNGLMNKEGDKTGKKEGIEEGNQEDNKEDNAIRVIQGQKYKMESWIVSLLVDEVLRILSDMDALAAAASPAVQTATRTRAGIHTEPEQVEQVAGDEDEGAEGEQAEEAGKDEDEVEEVEEVAEEEGEEEELLLTLTLGEAVDWMLAVLLSRFVLVV